jgi:hypothetical protein
VLRFSSIIILPGADYATSRVAKSAPDPLSDPQAVAGRFVGEDELEIEFSLQSLPDFFKYGSSACIDFRWRRAFDYRNRLLGHPGQRGQMGLVKTQERPRRLDHPRRE